MVASMTSASPPVVSQPHPRRRPESSVPCTPSVSTHPRDEARPAYHRRHVTSRIGHADRRPRPRPRAQGREDARFRAAHPRSLALRERGRGRRCPTASRWPGIVGSYHHLPMWVARGPRRPASPTSTATRTATSTSPTCRCSAATRPSRWSAPCRDRMARGNQFLLPDRGRDRRLRGARPPLRPAEVAVHELGDPGEHGGHPRRPRRDRPRQGPHVRRQVPRPLRRGAGRARRRRPLVPEERGVPADRRRAARSSSRSTTSRRWRARSSGATSRSC